MVTWNTLPMKKQPDGSWTIHLRLTSTHIYYGFLVHLKEHTRPILVHDVHARHQVRSGLNPQVLLSAFNTPHFEIIREDLQTVFVILILVTLVALLIRIGVLATNRKKSHSIKKYTRKKIWRSILIRTCILVVLTIAYIIILSDLRERTTQAAKPVTFRFKLPLLKDISRKYGITQTPVVKKVILAGSFSSWNPRDENFRMHKVGTYEWALSVYLEKGKNPYKFVIHLNDTSKLPSWSHGLIWQQDPGAQEFEQDSYGGLNSIYRIEDYAPIIDLINIAYWMIAIGLVTISLLELLLRLLMRLQTTLKLKLILLFLILLVFSNLFYVTYTSRQNVDNFKKTTSDHINSLHSMLLAKGVDFSRFRKSAERAKVNNVLRSFFSKTSLRYDYDIFANSQQIIDHVYLLDSQGHLICMTGYDANYTNKGYALESGPDYRWQSNYRFQFHQDYIRHWDNKRPKYFHDSEYKSPFRLSVNRWSGLYSRLTGFLVDSVYYPIYHNRKYQGYYIIGVLQWAYFYSSRDIFYFNLFLLFVFTLIYLFLINQLGNSVLDPLRELTDGLHAIKQGRLGNQLQIGSGDEIEELGQAYNFMTSELRSSRDKIEDYARNLEKKVEDRTAALRLANEQLKEMDRLKTLFLANISHELRTPITLMLAPLESLLAEELGKLPPPVTKFHRTMHANGLRLLKLINNLLDFSRLEAGKTKARFVKLDVGKAIEFLVSTLQSAADSRSLAVELDNLYEGVFLYLDKDMFEKIVMNLLSNAFKFTENGGRIRIGMEAGEKEVAITVSDSGIGIPPEKLDSIFDRFSQVDSSERRQYEGSGIGLALVKELTEFLQGSISVTSTPGEGSSFRVAFPTGKEHLPRNSSLVDDEEELVAVKDYQLVDFEAEQEEEAVSTTPDGAAAEAATQPTLQARILVVDDNRDMRQFIAYLLRELYQVNVAQDGQDGLDKARELHPNLIVSDVMMPRLSGYDLCRAIKDDPELKHIPVILLTAKADITQRIEGLEYGADDYLSKPFNSRELMVRIANLLHARELERALLLKQAEIDLDLQQAATVQKNILTAEEQYQTIAGLEIDVRYLPMNGLVSGDYYNISSFSSGTTAITIADATGHGAQAAMTTMQIDILVKETFDVKYPDERLEFINRMFTDVYQFKNFFTGFVAHIDNQVITYSSAAHPHQYLLRHKSGKLERLKTEGKIIGFLPHAEFKHQTISVESGDILFLFTDGITEAFNAQQQEFGEGRLETILAKNKGRAGNVAALNQTVLDAVDDFCRGKVNDDITLIAIRIA